MKIKKNSFRRTEISKACAFVCAVGFAALAANVAHATVFNIDGQPVPAARTYATSTDSINVYYNNDAGANTSAGNWTSGINLTLNPGVWLTGQTGLGSVPLAVFTNPSANGFGDNISFASNVSTLTLNGNNQITGIVGARFDGTANVIADPLSTITVYNTGNFFNNQVHASNINLMSGSSVQFLGDLGGALGTTGSPAVPVTTTTSLNYLGSDSTVTIGAGVTVNGSITNTNISNSTLVFNGTGTVTGNVGSSSTGIGTVQVKGVNSTSPSITSVVTVGGNLSTDYLQYQANTRVVVNGDLYLNVKTSSDALNVVAFGNTDGILEIGNDGDIVGRTIGGVPRNAITTTQANTGTLTMVSGTQSITGNVGQSGLSIKTLNIGAAGPVDVASTTTISGHVFAGTVSINNDAVSPTASSNLLMASGYNLTGNVVTDTNNMGTLTLMGGTQTVTGAVGTSTSSRLARVSSGAVGANSIFTDVIYANLVEGGYNAAVNTASGSSTYRANVFAHDVDVRGGVSNFEQSLSATGTTTIGVGTANFNLISGVPSVVTGSSPAVDTSTTATILFNGVGTANLGQGLTGTINFGGQTVTNGSVRTDATANLWDGEQITGAVSTTSPNTGVLNTRGSGTLGTAALPILDMVGTSVNPIWQLNINTQGGANELVTANGHIYAQTVNLNADATLRLIDGVNLTGNVTRTQTASPNPVTGNLQIHGTSTVTGGVGTASNALNTISAGVTGRTATFGGGVVYAQNLNYVTSSFPGVVQTGTVQFNGLTVGGTSTRTVTNGVLSGTDSDPMDLGFVGTANFGGGTGKFELGHGVDLVTQYKNSPTTQTAFTGANNATLRFLGSSIIDGQLGSATLAASGFIETIGNDTFGKIYAGANSSVVTFMNNVFVDQDTFYVSGTGTVNFVGNLYGNLKYDANGTVNVADGMSIYGTTTTTAASRGTLNFVGSTTTRADIGAVGAADRLLAVNFHAASSDTTALPVTASNATVNIGHNVYANTTTIGTTQNANANGTVANITAGVYLGNVLTLASSNVTLNTAGTVVGTDAISPVNFAHTKNANGTLTNTATVTQSTIGTGAITTNGATLNFAIGTTAWADPVGAVRGEGGIVNPATSSLITGGTGSTLVMNGSERINLSLLGSMRNGQAHTLVNVEGGVDTTDNNQVPSVANVKDNSYVITTTISRANGESGDLVMTATRANDVYITASNTTGHFSNPAALRLGTLAAAGSDYGSDMQTALNMLDIDQWGYGNNQANLAVQAKRLAPIANNSIGLSMFRTSSIVSDNIGQRMHEMRISEQAKPYDDKGFWIRSMYQQGKQNSLGAYDGFDSKISGFTMGIDARPNRESILGAALSYSNTKVEQRDFRAGDQATANAWHLSLYGAYDFTPELFIDGVVTASTANLDSARATAVGRTAKADTDVNQITGKVNVGYRFKLPDTAITITPLLSYEGSTLRQDAYRESGAGDIGLSTPSQRLNWNRGGVGLRLATTTMWGGMVAKPELTVMAQNETGNFAKPITSQFIGDYTNTSFTTAVADKAAYSRSSVRGILGLSLLMSKSSSLSVRYDHTNGDDFKSNAFDLIARWNF